MSTNKPTADDGDDMEPTREKFVAKNWNKKSDRDLRKMAPQQKSKYMAYEQPSKEAAEAQASSKKRLSERTKKTQQESMTLTEEEEIERIKHEKLIGQLKAAEARNRIRIMRLRYEANRSQEINHLIACQPTARKSVRLQALLPVHHEDKTPGDKLDKLQRARVETLLDDNRGILTGRT